MQFWIEVYNKMINENCILNENIQKDRYLLNISVTHKHALLRLLYTKII